MTLRSKIYPVMFSHITRYPFGSWPDNWLYNCDPGDLLLGPEQPKAEFAFICIDNSGTFLNLTPKQIYLHEPLVWPDHTQEHRTLHIADSKLIFS